MLDLTARIAAHRQPHLDCSQGRTRAQLLGTTSFAATHHLSKTIRRLEHFETTNKPPVYFSSLRFNYNNQVEGTARALYLYAPCNMSRNRRSAPQSKVSSHYSTSPISIESISRPAYVHICSAHELDVKITKSKQWLACIVACPRCLVPALTPASASASANWRSLASHSLLRAPVTNWRGHLHCNNTRNIVCWSCTAQSSGCS
jgi:hypothetical protein